MKLYLIDDFESKQVSVIKNVLQADDSKFVELDDFDVEDDYGNNPEIDEVFVVAKIEHNFLSKDMFKFVKSLLKKKFASSFKVLLIENMGDNSKIAIEWLASLKNDYLLNFSVIGEFNAENLSDELEILNKISDKQKTQPVVEVARSVEENRVLIYTDGACSGNPGAGGWGAILMHGNKAKEISGFEKETTNNRMELTAVIEALSMLKQPCIVELYSDSAYVVNAIKQGWLENWKNNGWLGSDKKQVKNIELWKTLDVLMQRHNVNFNKVKGHADNEFNNRCDALATGEIAKHANDN